MNSKILTIITFMAFGPPIGGLLVAIPLFVTGIAMGKPIEEGAILIVALPFFGYIVGIIPALLTGIAVTFFDPNMRFRRELLMTFVAGFFSTSATTAIYLILDSYGKSYSNFEDGLAALAILSLIGGVASLTLSFIRKSLHTENA